MPYLPIYSHTSSSGEMAGTPTSTGTLLGNLLLSLGTLPQPSAKVPAKASLSVMKPS